MVAPNTYPMGSRQIQNAQLRSSNTGTDNMDGNTSACNKDGNRYVVVVVHMPLDDVALVYKTVVHIDGPVFDGADASDDHGWKYHNYECHHSVVSYV